jgi:cytochrome c biogenesis protein CcdA
MENQLLSRLKKMNFWVAFGVGALLSSTSFPAALPYVASLEKIASAHLGLPTQWGFVLLYNLVYALPLIVPFVLFVFLRESILHKLNLHVQRLNTLITIVMLSGMGLFLIADSLAFFWWAKPLLQSRFL